MTEIDDYADVLDGPQRQVWTGVAESAQAIGGCLVGGTAVAVQLRHRRSEDLDLMTFQDFSGEAALGRLEARFGAVRRIDAGDNYCTAVVQSVRVDIFKALQRSSIGPRGIHLVASPQTICGMPVASIPDLLAAKLEILRFRAKVRDLIDLAAIDRHSGFTLEDGLGFYCRRYGHDTLPQEFNEIITILQDPEPLEPDPSFDQAKQPALAYLRERAVALGTEAARHYSLAAGPQPAPSAAHRRQEPADDTGDEPLSASEYLVASAKEPNRPADTGVLPSTGDAEDTARPLCGSRNTNDGEPCKLFESSCPYDEHRRGGRRR